ncbi:MAG: succinate--CoA ligase subunit alpha [Anaerolinea sp.]|nr:succinate--CoA ligase subunit alpha [Anaerolinea sp.]
MSILVNRENYVIVQGITGREGSQHTAEMIQYGTNIVAGVTPGKGGDWVHGKPVFDSVVAAVDATGANTSVIFVAAPTAADAIYEAIDAGIGLIICVTQGIPVMEMMRIREYLKQTRTRLVGPNCPGILTPADANIGIIPGYIAKSGNIGVVSRSGTLMYETVSALTRAGLGQSTIVGVGGDAIIGTNFVDVLSMFEEDAETERIVLIGEIGGHGEIDAAAYIKARMTKPVYGYIAGKTAPFGVLMGHAGAMVQDEKSAAAAKISALKAAGVRIADNPQEIPDLLRY